MSEILIDHVLLDRVTKAAKESPRLRMNYNFHESLSSPSQRLLNALEPGTVLPIHRHRHTAETYLGDNGIQLRWYVLVLLFLR